MRTFQYFKHFLCHSVTNDTISIGKGPLISGILSNTQILPNKQLTTDKTGRTNNTQKARRKKWKRKFVNWKSTHGYSQSDGGTKDGSRIPWMECKWKAPPETRKGVGKKKVFMKTWNQVQKDNQNQYGSKPLERTYSPSVIDNIISFEHINANGLNTKDNFVEIQHFLRTLQGINAGVFSVNEHTLDTTQPLLMKRIMETTKSVDPYMKVEMASCRFETAHNHWKPGGAMVGVSGKWASRICGRGSDPLGRWSWVDLRGKNFKIIRVISAYRVSQEVSSAGILTACQQQFRALVKENHGISSPKEGFGGPRT